MHISIRKEPVPFARWRKGKEARKRDGAAGALRTRRENRRRKHYRQRRGPSAEFGVNGEPPEAAPKGGRAPQRRHPPIRKGYAAATATAAMITR